MPNLMKTVTIFVVGLMVAGQALADSSRFLHIGSVIRLSVEEQEVHFNQPKANGERLLQFSVYGERAMTKTESFAVKVKTQITCEADGGIRVRQFHGEVSTDEGTIFDISFMPVYKTCAYHLDTHLIPLARDGRLKNVFVVIDYFANGRSYGTLGVETNDK
jgi:hypothetical protein